MHTFAKAHLTSVTIWILDPDCHQNLIILLAHCQPSLKISCKSVWKFLHKVASRQTDKQWWKHNLLGGGNEVNWFKIFVWLNVLPEATHWNSCSLTESCGKWHCCIDIGCLMLVPTSELDKTWNWMQLCFQTKAINLEMVQNIILLLHLHQVICTFLASAVL